MYCCVIEWLFAHSTITGTGSFTVLEQKTKRLCCQMLHIYLSIVQFYFTVALSLQVVNVF